MIRRKQNRNLLLPLMATSILSLAIDFYGSASLAQNANQTTNQNPNQKPSANGATNSAATNFNNRTQQTGPGLANSTTASLPAALSQVPTKRLKFTLYTRTEHGRDAVSNNESTSGGLSYVGAAYSLTPTKVLAVRQEFLYSRPKTGESGDYKVRDLFVGFNNTNLGTFAGDGTITSVTRLYLPTGEDARFVTKQQGSLLQWLIFNKPFGKFEIDYHVIGVYFNQSKNSYLNAKNEVTANLDYDIESWFGFTYNFTPWLSVYQTAGMDSIWKRPIDVKGVQRMQFAELETGVTVKPISQLSLSASLFNYANIYDPTEFHFYRDDETIYRFVVSATM